MIIIRILRRAAKMCPAAYAVQKLSLTIACALLLFAVLVLAFSGGFSIHTYRSFRLVYGLLETGSSVLLIGVLGAVLIEERQL